MIDREIGAYDPHWTRFACGGSMLRVDCYQFYDLGVKVHPLTAMKGGEPLGEVWSSLYDARQRLYEFFTSFPLKTALNPANTLYAAINAVVPENIMDLRFKDLEGNDKTVGFYHATTIRDAAIEVESVLKAELIGWDAYYVSQKAAFSTTELISQAEMMVPQPGRSYLTSRAVADVRQAGMCLAFNLGTAACFHAVRATEALIREYYKALLGDLPTIKQRNWGVYHRNMSKCALADSKVLGWMKHVTDQYRNPVLHPEEMLSADDAVEFINACYALISSIAKALQKLGVKSETDRARELQSNNPQGPLGIEGGDAETA